MAVQTFGEFFQQFGIMGSIVAFGAIGYLAVLLMAVGAGNLPMFAGGPAPGGISAVMTGAAGGGVSRAIGDGQWFMNRMTGQTFRNLLIAKMRFMAFHAGWNQTVTVMVAFLTGNFC